MRRVHVGELALHQLELADRLAELLALVHVGQHHVDAGLHDAERAAGQHRALVVEPAHQHADAVVRPRRARSPPAPRNPRTPARRCWSRACRACRASARWRSPCMPFSIEEGGDAARAGVRIGLGVDDQRVGVGAVGDPHLGAVEHVAVAALLGAQSASTTTSEPAPGSLIASAPTCSPEISFGRYLRFCASLPLRRIWLTQRLECAP